MNELPRVIKFEDIRKGDTIRRTSEGSGLTLYRTGVVSKQVTEGGATVWRTDEGGAVAWDRYEYGVTYELVERPKPILPTKAGSTIRATTKAGDFFPVLTRTQYCDWVGVDQEEGTLHILVDRDMVEWEEVTITPKETS